MRRDMAWMALAAVAMSVPAMAGAQAGLRPNMRPVPIGNIGQWFGPNNYPPEAVRASRQGRSVATLQIDANGAVTSCAITESSGTTVLDTATCTIAVAHLRFDPATDAAGKPIAGTYLLPVRWVLPNMAMPAIDVTAGRPPDSLVEVEFVFDAGGKITACRSTVTDAPGQKVDPCQGVVGTQTPRRWQRGGQPVGATIVQRFTEHVTIDP